MVLRTCVLIFFLFSSIYGDDIDLDYYYSPSLRSDQSLKCNSRLTQFNCQVKCDMKPALCIQGDCYCVSIATAIDKKTEIKSENILVRDNNLKHKKSVDEIVDFKEFKSPEIQHIELKSVYALRPTVRHHIAHFCPNLDVARECIRKCMVQGKPAFCGKDHVCYCGHKYTHTGDDKGGNAKDIYAQFKDLYEKYFGPNYNKEIKA